MENNYLENNLSMPIEKWLRYHQENVHHKQKYRDLSMEKNPFDLVVYEEIIDEIKPDVVVEIGTSEGGFSLWLSDRLKVFTGKGRIITIDIKEKGRVNIKNAGYENIISLVGDCNSEEIISEVKNNLGKDDKVMIIEDSSHTFDNTLRVMKNYQRVVSKGSYFVIEDGICDILNMEVVPGPMKAVEEFMKSDNDFEMDRNREKYIMTYNPKGYLKKIK